MQNKDINTQDFSNFQFLGIGEPTEKQIERKTARQEKREARKEDKNVVTTEALDTANVADGYIMSQTSETKTNYIPYIAIGSVIIAGIIGIVIYKKSQSK